MFHRMEQTTTERTAAVVRAEVARRKVRTQDLADILGVSRTTMWRRLNGEYPFNVDELARIAGHLGVPVSTLMPERDLAA